jgi:hypothetical protein
MPYVRRPVRLTSGEHPPTKPGSGRKRSGGGTKKRSLTEVQRNEITARLLAKWEQERIGVRRKGGKEKGVMTDGQRGKGDQADRRGSSPDSAETGIAVASIATSTDANITRSATPPRDRDIPWARRQGFADREAGKPCRKYKAFLITYDLAESEFTLRMWIAYKPPKTREARKRREPSRQSEPSPKERAFGTSALLRRVNPPEAIRDAWR